MNFDLNWFTTIPGMLISGGILLLIVALIILIVSGKKGKKEKQEIMDDNISNSIASTSIQNQDISMQVPVDTMNNNQNGVDLMVDDASNGLSSSALNNSVNVQPQEIQSQDLQSINTSINNNSMNIGEAPTISADNIVQPFVNSEQNINQVMNNDGSMNNMSIPSIEIPMPDVNPIQVNTNDVNNVSVPSAPSINSEPIVETPIVPNVSSDVITSAPVINSDIVNPTPIVNNDVMNSTQVVNSTPLQPYGGASLDVPKIDVNSSNHTIYGGADPLENTQSISVQKNVNVVPTINESSISNIPVINDTPIIGSPFSAPSVQPVVSNDATIITPQSTVVPNIQSVPPIQSMQQSVPPMQAVQNSIPVIGAIDDNGVI